MDTGRFWEAETTCTEIAEEKDSDANCPTEQNINPVHKLRQTMATIIKFKQEKKISSNYVSQNLHYFIK